MVDLSELQLIIIHHLHYRKKVRDGAYLALAPHDSVIPRVGFQNSGQQIHEINIMAGLASGGAWYFAGRIFVNHDNAIISTKNIKSVLFHKSHPEDVRTYDYCDPEFPNNLTDFIDVVVDNYIRAANLAHKRMWSRYGRKHKVKANMVA